MTAAFFAVKIQLTTPATRLTLVNGKEMFGVFQCLSVSIAFVFDSMCIHLHMHNHAYIHLVPRTYILSVCVCLCASSE